MFNTRRSREIEAFASFLARDFHDRSPPTKKEADKRQLAAIARAIDDACNRAAAYQREHRLGMYGRAKFGTSFKLEMKELGYSSDFADELTRQLLFRMAGK
jgi:hypothetical protein